MKRDVSSEGGFTLIEVIAVLLLTSVLVAGMTTVTGQWMRSWDRGARKLQDAGSATVALDRIRADIASALPLSPRDGEPSPVFVGSETGVRFVQASRDRHAPPGFEIVDYAAADEGFGLKRSRAAAVLPARLEQQEMEAATMVLQSSYKVTFAFLDSDGRVETTWRRPIVPAAVRIVVASAGAGPGLTTTIPVRAQLPLACLNEKSFSHCIDIAEGRAKPGEADSKPDDAPPQKGAPRQEAVR